MSTVFISWRRHVGVALDRHLTIRRTFLTALAGLFLQACTNLGPDYEEPTVTWLADWETDGGLAYPDAVHVVIGRKPG